MIMASKELLAAINNIQVGRDKTGQHTRHKPLLLLFALGRYQAGRGRLMNYGDVHHELKRIFEQHGATPRPAYPFVRLANDGLWELQNAVAVPRTSRGDITERQLLQSNVAGGLTAQHYAALERDSRLLCDAAQQLLKEHFPAGEHRAILASTRIDLGGC